VTWTAPSSRSSKDEKPEKEMSLQRLAETARDLEEKGQRASPYYVERHKRFALPMAALVFVLVGFPLGIRSHRGGRAVALASSFVIVVAYYILFTSLEGMAISRRLPAALAIWLPNLLFSALGMMLLRSTSVGVSTSWERM
jgi:lipopolysaccharide export LptBFGC system permease protein LptF